MSSGVWLDVLLVVVLVAYAVSGYRQGFVVSVLSFVGFLGGGALAMWATPWLFEQLPALTETTLRRTLVVLALVFVAASLGQGVAVAAAQRLKARVRLHSAQVLDSVLGAVVVLVATSLLMWFLAGALRVGTPGALGRAIGQSRVLGAIDRVVPPGTSQMFTQFRALLDRGGFPRVFDGLQAEPIRQVPAPESGIAALPAVAAAAPSVIKISGTASGCQQTQEGSGFVVAPGKVVTNAHVVAGLSTVALQVEGTGTPYEGMVVLFDPKRDLAVVSAPSLPAPALRLGDALAAKDSAVVAGFPLNGPYDVQPARVRQVLDARGADIYGQPGTDRQIYSLYVTVRPGNSGGPLLDTHGGVVGVVFAQSLDDASTGYALTLEEAAPVLDRAASASTPVTTGACVKE